MVQYETEDNGLGVAEMFATLVSKTWKAERQKGMLRLIQLQTEQVLLTYLLSASVNENNSFIVRSLAWKVIKDLETYINAQRKTATDETYKGHLILALERMKEPAQAKPTLHKEIPPGAPIGSDEEDIR
jgi:hypothetical protein